MEIIDAPLIDKVLKLHTLEGLDDTVKDFVSGLKDSKFNMNTFYNNIKTAEFKEKERDEMIISDAFAEYELYSNKIVYEKENYKSSIMHELFHLSSTVHGDDRIFSGFAQILKDKSEVIGIGLNEAYTCILDDRYFKKYTPEKEGLLAYSYYLCKQIVIYLENIIGEDVMEKYYSECNLKGVINILDTLTPHENTMDFIEALDNLMVICDLVSNYSMLLNLHSIFSDYRYIFDYLTYAMVESVTQKYVKKEIDDEEYKKALEGIKSVAKQQLVIGKYKILKSRRMSDRRFNETVERILECNKKRYI